jgi:hypothetical protein
MKRIQKYFLLLLLVLNGFFSMAQQLDPSVYKSEYVTALSASPMTLPVFNFNRSAHFPGYTTKTLQYAKLYVEVYPTIMPVPTTGSFVCTLTLTGKDATGVNAILFDDGTSSKTINVTINNATPSVVYFNDFTTKFSPSSVLTGVLVSATYTFNAPFTNANTGMQIKPRIEIGYGLNVDENLAVTSPPLSNGTVAFDPGSPRTATFSWNNNGQYFPAYQLQVLRLYNTNPNFPTVNLEPNLGTTIDWNNAININIENDLQSNINSAGAVSYNYTVAEGTGAYAWRVRPVGNIQPGGFANSSNWGTVWSTSLTSGTVKTFSDFTNPNETGYFYFSDPDDGKNWIYSRVFTEKTRVSESLSYGDYLLHKKQVQHYNPSKQTTLMMQYVMDYMGRPAVSTMSVPQQNLQGLLGYKKSFVQNSTGALFTAKDFDTDAAIAAPLGITINPVNGFNYYADNTDKSIPNSGGFPYSRTVFENSSNSRVSAQSGVGKDHAIGTAHTVQTLYATASDDELIRVLGDEAPKGSKVSKTTTIDQNGTASISYTDLNGKVIATCLSFNDNDITTQTLDPIPSAFSVNDVINNNVMASDGLLSTKRISFNTATPISLSYDLPCTDPVRLCGTTADSPCKYKLKIVIHDLKTPINRLEADYTSITMQGCSTSYHITPVVGDFKYMDKPGTPTATSLTFGPGDYIIEKRLIFDDGSNDDLVAAAMGDIKARIEGFVSGITDELKAISTEHDFAQFLAKYDYNIVQPVCTIISPVTCTYTLTPDVTRTTVPNYTLGQFKISMDDIVPANPYIKIFHLSSQCCDIQVPIEYIPPLVCPDPATVTGPSDYQVFYTYANTFLQRKGTELFGDINHFFTLSSTDEANLWGSTYLNHTNAQNDLKDMIYHMVTDVYRANSTETAATQYTCEALAECWTASLTAVAEYSGASPIDDNNTTGIDPDELNFDDMFDDMPSSGILKLFVGKKKKAKIRNEVISKSQSAASNALSGYDGPNLIKGFMNCAEYKYASVIVTMPSGQTSPFVSTVCDQTASTVLTIPAELSMYTSSNDQFNRIYGFKYVTYNAGTLLRQYTCEAASCFCPPVRETPACSLGGYPACYNDTEILYDQCAPGKTHVDWSFDQRATFAQCIQNAAGTSDVNTFNPDGDTDPSVSYSCSDLAANTDPDYIMVSDLTAELQKLENQCISSCDNHRDNFIKKTTQMFIDNCYNIVTTPVCTLLPGDVPLADIYTIADELVLQCKSMCDMSYLAGQDITCTQCENSIGQRTYVQVILGSAQEKLLSNLAKNGNIELDIVSRCAADVGTISCTITPGLPAGFTTCGKDYTTPAPVFICAPAATNPITCPLGLLDSNGLSGATPVIVETR